MSDGTYGTPEACPWCGRAIEASTNMYAKDAPAEGDVTVCLYCKRTAIVASVGLRRPTPEEQAELDADPRIQRVLDVMGYMS